MKSLLFLILGAALLSSISLAPNLLSLDNLRSVPPNPPKTVPYVDVDRYLGTWYEQSTIPFYFERNCEGTRATYSYNKDGTIRVDNLCYRNGVKHESVGKAFPDPEDKEKTNAKLKVEFASTLDIEANYWIVRLDKDYTYAVVSSPNYRYLWILSRASVMPQEQYQSIYNDLKNDGFSVQKLHRTKQQ